MSKVKYFGLFFIMLSFIQTASAFSDVNEEDKNFYIIKSLSEKNIIEGYEDGTFKPKKNVSRAEALKIVLLSANIEISDKNIKTNFNDVNKEDWFAKYIDKAVDLKIVDGYSNEKFYPNKTVNLAETLKILIESFNIDSELFPLYEDAGVCENWYDPYFEIAAENNLLIGLNDTDPSQEMTRSQLAVITFNAVQIKSGNIQICKATYYGEDFRGDNTASGEPFNPDDLTAAHKELPFGTIVRVTNLKNGKSVEVRINDRCPFTEGLEIDLSQAAFEEIAEISNGIINAQIEVLE